MARCPGLHSSNPSANETEGVVEKNATSVKGREKKKKKNEMPTLVLFVRVSSSLHFLLGYVHLDRAVLSLSTQNVL